MITVRVGYSPLDLPVREDGKRVALLLMVGRGRAGRSRGVGGFVLLVATVSSGCVGGDIARKPSKNNVPSEKEIIYCNVVCAHREHLPHTIQYNYKYDIVR